MADWFVSVDGSTTGPHPDEHVRHWVISGQVPPSALFWPDGGTSWLPLDAAWPDLGAGQPLPDTAAAGLQGDPMHSGSMQGGPMQGGPMQGGPMQGGPWPSGSMAGAPPGRGMTGPAGVAPGMTGPGMTGPAGPGMPAPARSGMYVLTDRLADFAGVERLEGFRPRELMSAVFRRYGREEVERHFATGLPGYTPDLQEIESGWPKPWMFVRLLGVSILVFSGFWLLVQVFQSVNLLPALILVGSFAVPVSTLVFFLEINTPRNVSLYLVIHCLVIGGLISLGLTLLLEQTTGHLGEAGTDFIDPFLVGISEEAAKLVAVLLITMRLPAQRYPWILNGMLFGAAVGAGFACFESAGYALQFLFDEDGFISVSSATHVIVVRGMLAPFGHVVWTALAAGALWRVKLDGPLRPRMLVHQRVLRMLLVVMLLHSVWDISPLHAKVPYLLSYLVLGLLAWVVAFGMLQGGLKQIKAAQLSGQQGHLEVSGNTTVLRSVGHIGR